jgi:hypothetical protein
MPRLPEVSDRDAALSAKFAYYFMKRHFKKLTGHENDAMLGPIRMYAHIPKMPRAVVISGSSSLGGMRPTTEARPCWPAGRADHNHRVPREVRTVWRLAREILPRRRRCRAWRAAGP